MEWNTESARRGLAGRVALLAGVVVSVLAMAACNTTEGAGRDIEALGDGIEDAAQDAKD
jgi:predicted small secreted protein